jgi:exodeoxyribonuclease VII small subunit
MTQNFEESFKRLEEILNKMNSGTIGLDESIKLYEEADKLVSQCQKRLTESEQKIEKLIKNRQGEVELDDNNKPMTESL